MALPASRTFSDRLAPAPMAIAAVLVAAAYFVGIQIGLALTFPPATTSLLWPPNAILTAALLLLPVRQWWVCLAALPVHVVPRTRRRHVAAARGPAVSHQLHRSADCREPRALAQRRADRVQHAAARDRVHQRGDRRARALVVRRRDARFGVSRRAGTGRSGASGRLRMR